MKMKQPNQLNELMIVNPGIPGNEKFLGRTQFFLGDDGTLYLHKGFAPFSQAAVLGETDLDVTTLSRYFLGEDGTLYEVI